MKRPRIILADDHQVLLDGLRTILAGDFDLVGTAADGAQLVQLARKLKPDVIVTDIVMPVMSGVEAVQALVREGLKFKVVFLTMQAETETALRAFRAGSLGYVTKSSASTELIQAIHEALAGRTFISPRIVNNLVGVLIGSADPFGYAATSSPFTARQIEVLQLVARGKTMKEVAAALNISTRTAEVHKYQMMQRIGIRTVAELIQHGIRLGLVEMSPMPSEW